MNQYLKAFSLLFVIAILQGCDGGSSGGGGTDGATDGGSTDGGGTDGSSTGGDTSGPEDDDANSAPQAHDITLRTDRSSAILDVQLMGDDPDNDTIVYVLDSSRDGEGYSLAFVETDAGMLHIVLNDNQVDTMAFAYRVSDGSRFSEPATLSIEFGEVDDSGLGANGISDEDYAAIDTAYFGDDLLASDDADGALPERIDLSNNFPTPGDQGITGSCVGWAVGYALKSYQEKVEEQWEYSTASTVFSPSWIYNQINNGVDQGSYMSEALQLIVESGAATLSTMPYSDSDYTSQPSSAARAEAGYYKAASYASVRSLDMVKRSLAARTPVSIIMEVYDSFNGLSGSNSVYSDYSGELTGYHAITIVGYDDNLFGGAVKVINSWGTDWGDGGYFWLPYAGISIVNEAYVLNDAPNSGELPEPVQPPVDETLPNLVVSDWSASYDPQAGGAGELQWQISNTGTSVASAGADVNLILSEDEKVDPTDILVVYEELSSDLAPGQVLFRDDSNALPFSFPLDTPDGDYYMAVWVDDLGEVAESDETDNISYGDRLVSLTGAQLPDLVVDSWWASWDLGSGDGELEYRVSNVGNLALSSTDWDINLILTEGTDIESTNGYFLFYEDGNYLLEPNETVVRDENSRAAFNLYRSALGVAIAPGDYYMSLWVDDQDIVEESREYNNLSTDNKAIQVSSSSKSEESGLIAHRFNGKSVPTDAKLLAKVTISSSETGEKKVTSFSRISEEGSMKVNGVLHEKQIRARDPIIFPVSGNKAMAAAKSDSDIAYKVLGSQ